ncbi:MAG: hypothetical protein ACOX68_05730 [Candidatus Limivicinus sp.]|jgi:hypothetical protein
MSSKRWIVGFLCVFLVLVLILAGTVIYIDPFMHYHKPLTDKFYYNLNNQRSMNRGIVKYFDYEAMITGSSETHNVKTTEAEDVFGLIFVKVPFAGGTCKEVNDCVETALESNDGLRLVIRTMDRMNFPDDKDRVREDFNYPSYLYDDNPFNDYKYIFNLDIFYHRCLNMIRESMDGKRGITPFDEYSYTVPGNVYGPENVLRGYGRFACSGEPMHLSEEEVAVLKGNIAQNITALPEKYPDVEFYYYLPPYSAVWYGVRVDNGELEKFLEAEQILIESVLPYDNIKLFSWSDDFQLTCDLNNYTDALHYGEWVDHLILRRMEEGRGLLTRGNYMDYIDSMRDFYYSYDYNSLFDQEDQEDPPPELDFIWEPTFNEF